MRGLNQHEKEFNTHQKTGGVMKDSINPHQTDRTTGGLLAITKNTTMKTGPYVRVKTAHQYKRIRLTIFLAALLLAARWNVNADETSTNPTTRVRRFRCIRLKATAASLPRYRLTSSIRHATVSRLDAPASASPMSTLVPIKTSKR
jgi:hypothetical protein